MNHGTYESKKYAWGARGSSPCGRTCGAGSEARRQEDEPRLSVALTVGTTGKLEQYSLVVHLQVAHQGLGRDIKASISGLIRECTLSWTPAIPPMLAKTKKFGAKAAKLV